MYVCRVYFLCFSNITLYENIYRSFKNHYTTEWLEFYFALLHLSCFDVFQSVLDIQNTSSAEMTCLFVRSHPLFIIGAQVNFCINFFSFWGPVTSCHYSRLILVLASINLIGIIELVCG